MKREAKRIVVTGATRGLGRALVESMAELGHTIVGCARSREGIEALREALPAPHAFAVVDVASSGNVDAWAKDVLSTFGPPDILINNAGVINRNASFWEVPAEEFSRVVDVNLKGPANVMRAFLPAIVERGSGVVVNMSSGWGRSVSPMVAPYCATKWAIEGLSFAVAQETPSGVAVAALNPGVIDTEMLRSAFGDGAASSPDPKEWARRAVPYILGLGPEDNGESLSVP